MENLFSLSATNLLLAANWPILHSGEGVIKSLKNGENKNGVAE